MGQSVIQQPNGKYAIWCSAGDQFLLVDGTEEDVHQEYRDRAIEEAKRVSDRVLARARGEQKPPPAYDLELCVHLAGDDLEDDLLQTIKKQLEGNNGQ